jgi:hypothetical protein
VGRVFNLAGPLKMMDINQKYINALRGLSNVGTAEQYQAVRPETFWEGALKENVSNHLYEAYKRGTFGNQEEE